MADFDWGKIAGPLVNIGGTLIGGALLGPAGAKLGPLAGTILAEALGVPADPDAINDAIATKPDAGSIVAKVEAAHGGAFRSVEEAYLADVQDARATTVQYVKEDSSLQWAPAVVSTLVVLGFFGALFGIAGGKLPESAMASMMVGVLVSEFRSVTAFWLGSSDGSKKKDNTIADAMKSAAGAVAGAIKPRAK